MGAQRLAAYRNLRTQLPAIRRLSAFSEAARHDDGWMRGVDFYSPTQLTRVLTRTLSRFHIHHGRYPDIAAPRGFNDWIVRSNFLRWMKIPESGNKLLTHRFIPDHMRAVIRCPPILWSGDDLGSADLSGLTAGSTYYLKAAHGSEMSRRFTWPVDEVGLRSLSGVGAQWLRTRYGFHDGEWWYNAFPPALMIEDDVGGNGYSVNCFAFRGAIGAVVLYGRSTHETITLSERFELLGQKNGDSDWRGLFGAQTLREVTRIAAELSRDIEFARFDFLIGSSGTVYLGEVTFSPGNGHSTRPAGVDEHLGRMWAASASR